MYVLFLITLLVSSNFLSVASLLPTIFDQGRKWILSVVRHKEDKICKMKLFQGTITSVNRRRENDRQAKKEKKDKE